jgi:ribosome-binding factor A
MSQRAEQIAEVIQRELNNFFIKEVEFSKDMLVTLTQVKVTPDLKHAYLYLSILPITKTGEALKQVNRNLGRARSHLSKKITLWKSPDLKAIVDDSALKDRKIERVLENLKK